MDEKIYLIAAIDCIIFGNTYNKIDLGNCELEYIASESKRGTLMMEEGGIPSLQLQIKLINKETMNIEWADIFYKSLKKYNFNDLFNLSIQDKTKFIFKAETLISCKKYATSIFVSPSKFLAELPKKLDKHDYPNTVMPRLLTDQSKKNILLYLETLLSSVEREIEASKNFKSK